MEGENTQDGAAAAGGEATQVSHIEPAAPVAQPTAPVTPAPVVASISERLSQGEAAKETAGDDAPVPVATLPFDISKLNVEQLQTLKAMLEVTPSRTSKKGKKPLIRLRKLGERIITDIGNAKNTLVRNQDTNFMEEVMIIPVKFLGDTNFTNVQYKEFIGAEQFTCEVLSKRSSEGEVVEGETVSRETGQLVELKYTTLEEYFTVQLPEGTVPATIEIEARMANA